jgi:hypothetical protein
MLSGLQLIVLGMMGEYLWRVCEETRRRPLFLVQELTGAFPRVERMLKGESCLAANQSLDAKFIMMAGPHSNGGSPA